MVKALIKTIASLFIYHINFNHSKHLSLTFVAILVKYCASHKSLSIFIPKSE